MSKPIPDPRRAASPAAEAIPRWRTASPGGEFERAPEAAHSRAYAVLKEAVLAGAFRPGEVVTLRSLAKQLAVSEMPVREALRRLTSEGAFEALPNRSARVPLLNRRELEQILDLRSYLEGKAAGLAARNITLVQIEHLRALQSGIMTSIHDDDAPTHTALNKAFHFEIYRIADNPALLPLIQMLWLRMAPLAVSTVQLLTGQEEAVRLAGGHGHERVLAALQARDPAAAEAAMTNDLLWPTTIEGYWESLEITTA